VAVESGLRFVSLRRVRLEPGKVSSVVVDPDPIDDGDVDDDRIEAVLSGRLVGSLTGAEFEEKMLDARAVEA
jgi:hypothetical protein